MIIRGGENIYPREIEEYLLSMQGVKDVQVAGMPARSTARRSARSSSARTGSASARMTCGTTAAGKISRIKVPRYVFFVDTYPMTASGKIQKYKLKEKGLALLKERDVEVALALPRLRGPRPGPPARPSQNSNTLRSAVVIHGT